MATVAKSIIYAWPSPLTSSTQPGTGASDFASASFGSKTLYFPETSSRVFKSVYAEISYHDSATATGGSMSRISVELRISGSANNSLYQSVYSTAGDSTGENMSFVGGPFNFTSFFNTYVPSNSSSIDIQAVSYTQDDTGASTVMLNPTFKLYCTYEHDDIDTTYIKTVIIPLESPTSNISTTFPGIIGTQQIPRLIATSSVDTSVVSSALFSSVEGNFTSSYTVTKSGRYRVAASTGFIDVDPTFVNVKVFNSSSNELLINSTGTTDVSFDQYVFISASSIPTKFRFEAGGNNGYDGGSYSIFQSQSINLGFLQESNINIRDYFIEIEGNETYASSTDIQLTGSITSSFSNLQNRFFSIERALNSETYDRLIWSVPTSSLPNVSQSHNFGLRSNVTCFYHIPVNLYVTYEYNKTNTTQVNNTILLGWNLNSPLNYNNAAVGSLNSTNVELTSFTIPENNPILQQSALRIQWSDVDFQTILLAKINEQASSTQYTEGSAGVNCGMRSLQHRFDVSASNANANTANVVLRKGLNYLTSSFYVNKNNSSNPTTTISNVNGYYILNYKSDVHPTKGVDGCSRFYYFANKELSTSDVSSATFTSTDFNYNLSNSSSLYVVDSLNSYMSFERNSTTLLDLGIQYTGSEAPQTPNNTITNPKKSTYKNVIASDPEAGSFITTYSTQNIFKNYKTSPNPILMDPFVVRKYVSLFNQPSTTQVFTMFGTTSTLVAHSYTFDFTGSIYNYTGDGSGIPVTIYQSGSTQAILQLTSSIGGKFSGTWFDDTVPIFASIDFGDKFGKSKLSIVTGLFDVYLTPFEYGYSNI
jgi:hypothetical protein